MTTAEAAELPEAIKQAGVLHLTVNSTYAPMEYRDPTTNDLVGLDIDLANEVAKRLGMKIVWSETPFAELIHHESVSRGRDLTPTKARRFADEYATMQRRWGADLLNDLYYSPHLTYGREDFSLRLR